MIPSIAVSLLKLGLAGPLAHPIEKKKVAAAELPHVTMKCSDIILYRLKQIHIYTHIIFTIYMLKMECS